MKVPSKVMMKKVLNITIMLLLISSSTQSEFQIKLFKELIRNQNNVPNKSISPIGLYQVMSLLSNGAKGSTQEEILNSMKMGKIEDIIGLNNKNINEISRINSEPEIQVPSAILTKISPDEQFNEIANKYDILCRKLTGAKRINAYFDTKTNHEVEEFINDDIIDGSEILLLNTVLFKMNWLNKFIVEDRKVSRFYAEGKEQEANYVHMMHQFLINHRYYEDDKFQVIEIPFDGLYYSAFIMLPKEKVDLNKYIIDELTEDEIKKYFFSISQTPFVDFYLPQFEIHVENLLNNLFANIGFNKIFSDQQADFSNISDKIKLFVNKIYQKFNFEINEIGTNKFDYDLFMSQNEKGSVNTEENKKLKEQREQYIKSLDPKKVINMSVSRPFLFIIKQLSIYDNFLVMAKIDNISRKK